MNRVGLVLLVLLVILKRSSLETDVLITGSAVPGSATSSSVPCALTVPASVGAVMAGIPSTHVPCSGSPAFECVTNLILLTAANSPPESTYLHDSLTTLSPAVSGNTVHYIGTIICTHDVVNARSWGALGGASAVLSTGRVGPLVTLGLLTVRVLITGCTRAFETSWSGHNLWSVMVLAVVGGMSGLSTLLLASPTSHGTPIEILTSKSPSVGTSFGSSMSSGHATAASRRALCDFLVVLADLMLSAFGVWCKVVSLVRLVSASPVATTGGTHGGAPIVIEVVVASAASITSTGSVECLSMSCLTRTVTCESST